MSRESGRGEYRPDFDVSGKNYYEILGVLPTASSNDIKAAFRKLSIQHHPDKGGNEKTYQFITEAYNTLRDARLRAEYDSQIKQTAKSSATSQSTSSDYQTPPNSPFTRRWEERVRQAHERINQAAERHRQRQERGRRFVNINADANNNSYTDSSPFNEQERQSYPDILKPERRFIERDGLSILIEGVGLLAREYLINPNTKKPLSPIPYGKIFVRDGLVIGQSGVGLLITENLLDRKTGRQMTNFGYDRIERRNGKIVGIRKRLLSPEIAEEISELS
jgi:curved DNA-binding protein CbpA